MTDSNDKIALYEKNYFTVSQRVIRHGISEVANSKGIRPRIIDFIVEILIGDTIKIFRSIHSNDKGFELIVRGENPSLYYLRYNYHEIILKFAIWLDAKYITYIEDTDLDIYLSEEHEPTLHGIREEHDIIEY